MSRHDRWCIAYADACESALAFYVPETGEHVTRYGRISAIECVRRGQGYHFGWLCTCLPSGSTAECEHIEKGKLMRCGWNEELDPTLEALPAEPGEVRRCPECGGPTLSYTVGI